MYPLVSARAVARAFTYEVPEGVGKGAVVSVPFGRSQVRGVVVGLEDAPPLGVKAAPVGRVLDELPPALVDLALWLAEYYGSTPARALELVAPRMRARRGERKPLPDGTARRGGAGLADPRARGRARPDRRGHGRGHRALSALRRDRQRQDRGLPPGLRGRARARAGRDRARARDRADAAGARPVPGPLRRADRAAPLGSDRGRAARRARADRLRGGARGGRCALGGVRAGARARADRGRRGARPVLQAGLRPALRRSDGGGEAGLARGCGRDLRQRDAAARELGRAGPARARRPARRSPPSGARRRPAA